MNGSSELTRLLLSHGASAREANQKGWTALHLAADTGVSDVGKMLLDAGALVSAKNGVRAHRRVAVCGCILALRCGRAVRACARGVCVFHCACQRTCSRLRAVHHRRASPPC